MVQTRRKPSSSSSSTSKNETENGDENESGSGSGSYEKKRKQRLEENKKKMEQLNLHHLSEALLNAPIKPKRPYVKKPKVELPPDWQPRRSSRMSDKSLPSYKEYEEVTTRGDYSSIRFVRREDYYEVEISDEKRLDAIVRAEKLESSLGSDFPTFIKPLLHSHVNRYYFHLPTKFCKTHRLNQDQVFTLVDEDGHKWRFKCKIRSKHSLLGWTQFVNHHQLVDGDVLIFQLVEPATFKVYIIRVNASGEDGQQGSEEL